MLNLVDFGLGVFLLMCGLGLSLLNLRRIVKKSRVFFPAVLLSENIFLTCIGIAFIIRSVYELNPISTEMSDIEERSVAIMKTADMNCNFESILMSYGPFIISVVNSFVSLIIDNYMHYRMIADVKRNEDENEVRELSDNFSVNSGFKFKKIFLYMKKYFTFIAITLQWVLPGLLALIMYSIDIKQMTVVGETKSFDKSCMALLDVNEKNCTLQPTGIDIPQINQNWKFLTMYDKDFHNTSDQRVDNIVENVYSILANLQNESHYADVVVSTRPLLRKPKQDTEQKCMKICFLDNKKLLLYIFGVSVVSFFVPITISTIILTKIHIMNVKNQNVKTYVNRELIYNVLFWTPVMFDTLLSISLCSYTMNGMRTSMFNVIANVYQAVKNFVNTKYFKDNSILPI